MSKEPDCENCELDSCDKCPQKSVQIRTKKENLWALEDFADELIRVLGKHKTEEETAFFRFFHNEQKVIKSIVTNFPAFRRSNVIYGLNHFIEEFCKITRITNFDDEETSPKYENMEIKRNKFELLLVNGYYFLKWRNTKFILELYFEGRSMWYKVWFRPKDEKKATRLSNAIGKYLKDHDYMRGEKLVMDSYGYASFLKYPVLHWNDVILSKAIKEEFMLNIIFPLKNEKKCKIKNVPWRRGLLLGGQAGTGKTQVCRVLCSELPKGVTVLWSTPKALHNEGMIEHLFEAARFFSPTLIVIEDIDFIGTSRDFTQNPILGELLTQLDGNDPNDGIFVIATSNRPEYLDKALANRPSRFDVQVKFSLPDEKDRIALVKLFTGEMEFAEPLNYKNVAYRMNGLTGAHIKEIFVYCQLKALKRDGKISTKDVNDRIGLYMKNLKKNKLIM